MSFKLNYCHPEGLFTISVVELPPGGQRWADLGLGQIYAKDPVARKYVAPPSQTSFKLSNTSRTYPGSHEGTMCLESGNAAFLLMYAMSGELSGYSIAVILLSLTIAL